jgi:hypothetical protein
MNLQKPIGRTFDFDGTSYTMKAGQLDGETCEAIDAAIAASKTRCAFEMIERIDALPSETSSQAKAKIMVLNEARELMRSIKPAMLGELSDALQTDREVVAVMLHRTCTPYLSIEKARDIVRRYPVFHDLGLMVWLSSGVNEAGKSELRRMALRGGEDRSSSGGESSADST